MCRWSEYKQQIIILGYELSSGVKKYFEDHAQLSEKAYFFDSLLSFGTPQIIWLCVLASARQFIEGTQPLCKLARDSFLIW